MVYPNHLYAAMVGTIQAFFADYTRAPHDGASVLSNTLTPDCLRYLRPYSFTDSFGFPRDFSFNNTLYESSIAGELSVTTSANWTLDITTVDVQQMKASALTQYHVTLCSTDSYLLEFSWFWDFTPDGTKIKKIVEFVDPVPTLNESSKAAELVASGQNC